VVLPLAAAGAGTAAAAGAGTAAAVAGTAATAGAGTGAPVGAGLPGGRGRARAAHREPPCWPPEPHARARCPSCPSSARLCPLSPGTSLPLPPFLARRSPLRLTLHLRLTPPSASLWTGLPPFPPSSGLLAPPVPLASPMRPCSATASASASASASAAASASASASRPITSCAGAGG